MTSQYTEAAAGRPDRSEQDVPRFDELEALESIEVYEPEGSKVPVIEPKSLPKEYLTRAHNLLPETYGRLLRNFEKEFWYLTIVHSTQANELGQLGASVTLIGSGMNVCTEGVIYGDTWQKVDEKLMAWLDSRRVAR